MPGSDYWRGVWLKTERAKEHVRDLESRVLEFMNRKPFRAVITLDAETGHHVISAEATEQPPIWWGAIAGDAVHNLRIALDLMVYELVRANGQAPSSSTGFPIADTLEEYMALRHARLAGVDAHAAAHIDELEPYRRGNLALWRLEQLDNVDRFASLVPITAARKGAIEVLSNLDFPNTPIPISPGYPNRAVYPIENGTELARVSRAHQPGDLAVNAGAAFYVAFGEPAAVSGEPVVPLLQSLIRATDAIVQPFLRPLIQMAG